ncbi:autotransporter domain-containing protein [Pantoea ananatis]|uniref:autotransporter domain-containing protein n=1 Tax=Pantoea ananas TaxID=553 RepID=UPI0039B8CCCB
MPAGLTPPACRPRATTTGNLGLRLEWRRQTSWGRLTPQFRLEYQHDFQGRGDATLGYADIVGGTLYRTGQSAGARTLIRPFGAPSPGGRRERLAPLPPGEGLG